MKYIFRGHIIFEYKPDDKWDKVIQHTVSLTVALEME
jgi:hypothetical protein